MRCGVADELNGKDFVALVRLSDPEDRTITEVGQTCERVPAAKRGGTASDALAYLLASHLIAPVSPAPAVTIPATPIVVESIAVAAPPTPDPVDAAPAGLPQPDGDA